MLASNPESFNIAGNQLKCQC